MASADVVSTTTQFMPILQVALGGLLTFMGGYFGTTLTDKRRDKREERNLALAFRGEVVAIRKIVAHRKYLEHLSQAIAHMKETNQPVVLSILVTRDYFSVFNKNVDKLGTLSHPLPELIASFYIFAAAVLEDLEALRKEELGESAAELLPVLDELLSLAKETLRHADMIEKEITSRYGHIESKRNTG